MKTEISFRKLKPVAREFETCIRLTNRNRAEVTTVSDILRHSEDEALCEVSGKLGKRSEEIGHILETMRSMSSTLEIIMSVYSDCEEKVQDLMEGGRLRRKLIRTPKENSLNHFTVILKNMDLHFKI